MSTNSVTIFAADSHAVAFTTKKGELQSITPEGALFKGGLALAALKDAATASALIKASNGRYQAAVDIMSVAFPAVHKAAMTYTVTGPAANKTAFTQHCHAVLNATPKAGKDFTAKQINARGLATAFLKANAPADLVTPLPMVEEV